MTPAARVQAAAEVLDVIAGGVAAEAALVRWARGARFAGSKDRAAVRDHVFDVLRCRRSAAALGGGGSGRALMLGLLRLQGVDPDTVFTGAGHAPAPLSTAERSGGQPPEGAAALDLPDWLEPLWQASLGDRADEVAEALRHRAPVMLRVNTAKATRDAARAALQTEGITADPVAISPTALRVGAGARQIAGSQVFAQGIVELQDGASQALVDELSLPISGKIMDFCAGGGGKSLAMAPRTRARLFAHDANPTRLKDLPERARRAGARITVLPSHRVQAEAPFDLVLTDVPCSGSGAWRRAPEGKWLLTPERLDELTATQDTILDRAAGLVAQGGTLAYATCSVLAAENTDRIAAFLMRHPEWHLRARQQWLPGTDGDGFFLAILANSRE